MRRRVVVTGMSAITAIGNGLAEYHDALLSGKGGVGPIKSFDPAGQTVNHAAEVKNFEAGDHLDRKEAKRLDRFSQFAVIVSRWAWNDAGLVDYAGDKSRCGVILGSGIGGILTMEKEHCTLLDKGPTRISPFLVPMMIGNMASGNVSIDLGLKGPNMVVVTACASSSHAMGEAFTMIRDGRADICVTGGCEAAITPLTVGGFASMKALSTRNDPTASRPFDRDRDGFVMGEGAGSLIFENYESAKARGARIYAEVLGYGATADANHITSPAPGGEGAVRSMLLAINQGGLKPEDIDYINAHGTSTPLNDKFETMAIKTVFGEHSKKLAISSTKSMIGHLLGASGSAEAVATILGIYHEFIPPTINYQNRDPELDLDYVTEGSRKARINYALSNSFGFGGQNGTLLFGKFRD